jgi:hypothetical protein
MTDLKTAVDRLHHRRDLLELRSEQLQERATAMADERDRLVRALAAFRLPAER